ncbi:MAG: hypothetical protein HGB10_04920 [Coriobacteriia bacterium]|nr:hypothetical protein [Coriobacteriia bacterium]
MLRRIAVIATAAVLLVAATSSTAFGWGNGGPDDWHYGTHDWVLDHAITLAGQGGDWVDVRAALYASDDIDYRATPTSVPRHVGVGVRGGPQAVSDEYYQVVTAYNAGDYADASEHLGRLAHYYADEVQPFHTTTAGFVSNNPRHAPYEYEVDDMTPSYSSMSSWISPRSRRSVSDVRASAFHAAAYAGTKYADLNASYRANNNNVAGIGKTNTGLVLNRAVNDLADIIAAVPRGEGLSQAPATMKQRMWRPNYYFPRSSDSHSAVIRSDVYCYDENGKPMPGVGVTFNWPLASGIKSRVAYTDANGFAYTWEVPGAGVSLMRKRALTAKTVQSSEVATSATWFMPTPMLASGLSGMKSSLSNTRPKRYSTITSRVRIRNTAGKAVAGLPVTFYWKFGSGTKKLTAVTNSSGVASTSCNIGGAAAGRRVYVRARAYSGKQKRESASSFIPH